MTPLSQPIYCLHKYFHLQFFFPQCYYMLCLYAKEIEKDLWKYKGHIKPFIVYGLLPTLNTQDYSATCNRPRYFWNILNMLFSFAYIIYYYLNILPTPGLCRTICYSSCETQELHEYHLFQATPCPPPRCFEILIYAGLFCSYHIIL